MWLSTNWFSEPKSKADLGDVNGDADGGATLCRDTVGRLVPASQGSSYEEAVALATPGHATDLKISHTVRDASDPLCVLLAGARPRQVGKVA